MVATATICEVSSVDRPEKKNLRKGQDEFISQERDSQIHLWVAFPQLSQTCNPSRDHSFLNPTPVLSDDPRWVHLHHDWQPHSLASLSTCQSCILMALCYYGSLMLSLFFSSLSGYSLSKYWLKSYQMPGTEKTAVNETSVPASRSWQPVGKGHWTISALQVG